MDVLVVGDSKRTPELRHEIPLWIPDPFVYLELGGRRIAAVSAMEAPRVEALGVGLEVRTFEEFGADELRRAGLDVNSYAIELVLRIVTGLGVTGASVPLEFPLGVADALRASGVELMTDQRLFDDRRRRKSAHELAGITRAQRAAEAGMAAAREVLRSAARSNGGLSVDGEPLTCEFLKEHVRTAFLASGAVAEDMVVSHGPQTAIAHDMGSGPIALDDVVLLDLFPMDPGSACFADMTRTFAVGDVPDEIRRWHALCREALELALDEIGPGVNGGDVHRLVSSFFAERGFPTLLTKSEGKVPRDGFFHGLGHGVGLAVHESPSIGVVGEELVPGDVITLEPGLYRHGFGGVRVEDLLLVTDDGCDVLTDFPYDLEV